MMDGPGIGNPYERELHYYRRECNELGARVLRLQEEQSQAYREARRSRTVVRLVRETYRIGDLARTAQDVGGPILEVIVDNALCDAAALLREEPRGSGQFLVAHAIGVAEAAAASAALIRDPPEFCYTGSGPAASPAPEGLLDVLRMPFVLWAYDRSSGCALVIGNRSEGNVSRPFESGDQELVESALSVYLDVLYRKQAEAQLRQAKQAAEDASYERTRFLDRMSRELSEPLQQIVDSSEALACELAPLGGSEPLRERARRVVLDARRALALADQATRFTSPEEQPPLLDVEWVGLSEIVGKVVRHNYANSLKRGVTWRPPCRAGRWRCAWTASGCSERCKPWWATRWARSRKGPRCACTPPGAATAAWRSWWAPPRASGRGSRRRRTESSATARAIRRARKASSTRRGGSSPPTAASWWPRCAPTASGKRASSCPRASPGTTNWPARDPPERPTRARRASASARARWGGVHAAGSGHIPPPGSATRTRDRGGPRPPSRPCEARTPPLRWGCPAAGGTS